MHTLMVSEHSGVHGPLKPLGHVETDREERLRGLDPWSSAVSLLAAAWYRVPEGRILHPLITTRRVRR
jgi:hypothetical protein